MIDALKHPMTRAPVPVLESNAQWIHNTPTTAPLPMAILGIRGMQRGRSKHSASPSRSISRIHFVLSASHTGNHSDTIKGPLRLASRRSASRCLLAFLGHRVLDLVLAQE
jgi:hypothetical protein